MEELKDASIHHTAIKISNEIKNMKLYGQLYKTVQVNKRKTKFITKDTRAFIEVAFLVLKCFFFLSFY